MKNKTLRGLLRLAAFGLCFVPVLLFANTFLIKTDTYARLTLAEMKQRSDIDMGWKAFRWAFPARRCKPIWR